MVKRSVAAHAFGPGEQVAFLPYKGGEICQRCGHQGEPLEPLFDLRLAAELIPMQATSLSVHLSRHREKYPPRYRLEGPAHRRVRLLTASEIRQIRVAVLRGRGRYV